jgi:hypothetical protein
VSLKEVPLVFMVLALSVVVSDVVEEFSLLLEDLVLEAAGEEVVLLLVEDVYLRLSPATTLELLEEVILTADTRLLELLQQLLSHSQTPLFNGLILFEIFALSEEGVLINGFASSLLVAPLVNILLVYVLRHVRVDFLV